MICVMEFILFWAIEKHDFHEINECSRRQPEVSFFLRGLFFFFLLSPSLGDHRQSSHLDHPLLPSVHSAGASVPQALFLDLVLPLISPEDCTLSSVMSECPQGTTASGIHIFVECLLLKSRLGLKLVLNNNDGSCVVPVPGLRLEKAWQPLLLHS